MRHILHLFAFDLKALRIWLLAFAGVIVAQVGIYEFVPYQSSALSNFIFGDSGLPLLRTGLTALITAVLVQRDALVGSTSLWRTKAIPRWALFASKLTTLVLTLVIPPAVVFAAIVLSAGLALGDAMAAAGDVALRQAAIVLAALPLAVVTGTLAHFLIGIGDLVALGGLWALLGTWMRTVWPHAAIDAHGLGPLVTTVILALGAAVVVALQYLSLRTKRSIAILAVFLVMAAASTWLLRGSTEAHVVTWDPASTVMTQDGRLVPIGSGPGTLERAPVGQMPGSSASAGTVADAVVLSIDPESLATGQGWEGPPSSRVAVTSVFGKVEVAGAPDPLVLSPIEIESALTYPGGDTVQWGPRRLGSREPVGRRSLSANDQPYRAIRAAIGGLVFDLPAGVPPARDWNIDLVAVPKAIRSRHDDSEAALSARVTFRASRYVAGVTIPLRPGASFTVPNRHVSVVSVARLARGTLVTVRDSTVGYRGGLLGRAYYGEPNCLLKNAARRQAVVLRSRFTLLGRSSYFFAGIGFAAAGAGYLYTVTYALRTFDESGPEGEFQPDDAWLKDAELVVISREELGQITLPLRAQNLRLPPPGGGGA